MMTWTSTAAFLHMGGHGLYVWGAYGLAAALVLLEPVLARRRHRAALAALGHPDDGGAP